MWNYLKTINFIKSSAQFVLFGKKSRNFICIITHYLVNALEKYIVNFHLLLFSLGYANLLPPLGLGTLCQTDLCRAASSSFCLSSMYPFLRESFPEYLSWQTIPNKVEGFPLLVITLIYFLLSA